MPLGALRVARRSFHLRTCPPFATHRDNSAQLPHQTTRNAPAPSGPAGTPPPVLEELRVENLLLIERAELRLGSGLNALTGETGAGKTVLAHALDLLLGGKPRSGIVRPGASEAHVQGVFALP